MLNSRRHRWGGSESGTVSYPCWATFRYPATGAGENARKDIAKDGFKLLKEGDPNGQYWVPAMSDAPLRGYNGRHEWFWEPGDEAHIYPVDKLVEMYEKSVGRNSTLILGLTPNADGLMPAEDVQRLQEFGAEIKRRYANPVATTAGSGKQLVMKLDKKQRINQVVLMENIAKGERVRKFSGRRKNKRRMANHFRGLLHRPQVHPSAFQIWKSRLWRLNILASTAEPDIKVLAVYHNEK